MFIWNTEWEHNLDYSKMYAFEEKNKKKIIKKKKKKDMTDIDSSKPDTSAMSGSNTDSSDIMATTNETELTIDEDIKCFFLERKI